MNHEQSQIQLYDVPVSVHNIHKCTRANATECITHVGVVFYVVVVLLFNLNRSPGLLIRVSQATKSEMCFEANKQAGKKPISP